MKRFIFLIIVLTFSSSLFALDNDYLSFRITPRFEVLNGSINEYVFNEACLNTDNKESQLDWDIKTIPSFGINADFNLVKYININLDSSVGIPIKSGNMQDYDWLNFRYWKNEKDLEFPFNNVINVYSFGINKPWYNADTQILNAIYG